LVIVELIGEAPAIFQHLVCKVRRADGEFVAYELSNSSKLMLRNRAFREVVGRPSLIPFGEVRVRYPPQLA